MRCRWTAQKKDDAFAKKVADAQRCRRLQLNAWNVWKASLGSTTVPTTICSLCACVRARVCVCVYPSRALLYFPIGTLP